MTTDRTVIMKKTRGMRIEIPFEIHKRVKVIKDARRYAGHKDTMQDVVLALVRKGLDQVEIENASYPQLEPKKKPQTHQLSNLFEAAVK